MASWSEAQGQRTPRCPRLTPCRHCAIVSHANPFTGRDAVEDDGLSLIGKDHLCLLARGVACSTRLILRLHRVLRAEQENHFREN